MSESVERRKERLWKLCNKFVKDQRISCKETVYQTDRVIENGYDFISKIVNIVGYHKPKDDE